MTNFLTELTPVLTMLCAVGIGPACLLLIVFGWLTRRRHSTRDRPFLNWRLAVSLLIWLPFTGFMCLLFLFSIYGDRFDDAPRAVSFGELAPWLSLHVVYIGVGAGLAYLMLAPIKRQVS